MCRGGFLFVSLWTLIISIWNINLYCVECLFRRIVPSTNPADHLIKFVLVDIFHKQIPILKF